MSHAHQHTWHEMSRHQTSAGAVVYERCSCHAVRLREGVIVYPDDSVSPR